MAIYRLEGYDEQNWNVEKSFFYREIHRTNRNMLLVLLLFFCLLTVILIYPYTVKLLLNKQSAVPMTETELFSDFMGVSFGKLPFSTTFENSDEYGNNPGLKRLAYCENSQFLFTVTAEKMLPSNIVPVENEVPTLVESDSSGESYVEYVLLQIGEKYLLTKQPVGTKELTQSGMLCYLPKDIRKIAAEASGIPEDEFIPVLFDTGREIFSTLKTDLLLWLILFLIWLSFFIPLVRRIIDPTRHEAYRKMYVYAGPTEENIKALDRELAGEGNLKTFRKIVTPSWVITRKFLSFDAKMKDRN